MVDSQGNAIFTNKGDWYKIALADGTELGLGKPYPSSQGNGRTLVQIVPAGQGMVFRYQRVDGQHLDHRGWPEQDKGWLRGIQVKSDGTEVIQEMSLSYEPLRLCMYSSLDNYGFKAHPLPGNRIALYGYNRHGTVCGLRVTPEGGIIGHESSTHPLALDCSFVPVGGYSSDLF